MARLDGEDIGYGFHRDLKLISEVQAPSRSATRFFYAAFSAAAGISLLFTIPRIFGAIKGGGDAPDLWETAGNAAINTGGIIVLVALFFWDNKRGEEQLAEITKDETLSSLPSHLSTNQVVKLVQLRDTVRPRERRPFPRPCRKLRGSELSSSGKILVFIRLVRLFNLFRLIRGRQKSEGVAPGEDGMPDPPQIVNELPPIEAFLSKLER
ncbi:hypothetical protein NC653_033342 [Populus alba x Populus x berolinensis]|uniref:Uncharacterized protein n=1 Tax=Populus alba x Populus x berolinensis TaxID=444605 RepID=A0AAD6LTN0_9ROSI|nr:hypothetical protein NC653_033342 [Populus alba x Populus x berolinensis]